MGVGGVGRSRGRSRRTGPGKGVIWSKRRARRVNKVASQSAWALTLSVKRDLAYDLDMRGAVAHVAQGMAEFFRDQLKRGEKPGGGRQDTVEPETKAIDARQGDQMGLRSSYMAEHWWQGRLRGTAIKATRFVKPYGGRAGPKPSKRSGLERDQLLNVLLKRGIDFQGVGGKAEKRARKLFGEWMRTTTGEKPGVAKPRIKGGTLPEMT